MNRNEQGYYINYILQAMDSAPIPFHSQDLHTEVVEATIDQPLMLLAYNTECGISLKIELAPEYICFDIELEICDNFLPTRFAYDDDFEGKVQSFITLVEKAITFKGDCKEFSMVNKPGGSGN